jgi:HAD superfamily hydrolase (TIGR01450 family)
VKKLGSLGIDSDEESIILSTDGVIAYLQDLGVQEIYAVGTRSMQEMFTRAKIRVDSEKPKFVVLGFDTELTYTKIRNAALFMQKGVELLVTHPDMVCPTPEGPIPDTGAIVALLEKATGRGPKKIFGKPNVEMITHILEKFGATPDEVVIIGDRIYTDMELANRLPCDFILVLSGETGPSDISRLKRRPALIAENLGQIRTPQYQPFS